MITLSYGYQNPEAGDRGSVWFPALNANIVRVNGHSHNGTDSTLLSAAVISKGTVTVSAGSWSLVSTAKYKQTVTVPAGFNMTDFTIDTRLSTGHLVYPTIEKVSGTTFDIYTLDNTLTYTVIFR